MNIVDKINSSKNIQFILLYFSLQIPSLRILYKILPDYSYLIIPVFLVLVTLFYFLLFNIKSTLFNKCVDSVVFTLSVLLIITIANYYLYPIVDARKFLMKGCDQDDAIIAVVNALFSGNSPYDVETYGNPGASTGPGLAILLSPFILCKTYFLITPVMIGILLFLINKSVKSIKSINYFLLLLISSPIFWELMTNGSDLIAFGILCLIPIFIWSNSYSLFQKTLIIVFLAMILTSRIIFIYLSPIFALFFNKENLKHWIKYSISIVVIVSFIHLIFYLIEPSVYSPILLINKGLKLLNTPVILISLIFLFVMLYQTFQSANNFINNLFLLWCWIAIPLFFVTVASIDYSENILDQYPFTYFGPQIPLYLTYFTINNIK